MNLSTVREWLKGKKTYLTAVIGLLTAISAWAAGEIEGTALAAAIWSAVSTICIRAGIGGAKAGAILLACSLWVGGCSPGVEKWGAYAADNLGELRADIRTLASDAESADSAAFERQLDLHYGDFYGPDGAPAALTRDQLATKRASLSKIVLGRDAQRAQRADQLRVLEAKLDRVASGVAQMRRINAAWWRLSQDPQTQALLERVLVALENRERSVQK